jgi:hypothetical protein
MKRPPDMSSSQFRKALAARGWRKVLVWIDTGNGLSIGLVMINGKFNYRASLAHAIREVAKQSEAQNPRS